jgi:hypothetical protein
MAVALTYSADDKNRCIAVPGVARLVCIGWRRLRIGALDAASTPTAQGSSAQWRTADPRIMASAVRRPAVAGMTDLAQRPIKSRKAMHPTGACRHHDDGGIALTRLLPAWSV